MVDWNSPQELEKAADALSKMIFCALGVVVWEIFSTFGFEWSLMTRIRPFRWPLSTFQVHRRFVYPFELICTHPVFFFLARYGIAMALIALTVSVTITTKIDCQGLYTFIAWAGNLAMLASSTSLMLRTIALWERRLIVVVPLGILCLGHWGVLHRTMFMLRVQWDDNSRGCVVTYTNHTLNNLTFCYTMGFDFVILVYTTIALTTRHNVRTDLWKLLFQDGLVYFLVTFTANCFPTVFNVLNLSTIINVITTIPPAVVSSIASCRAVMRLMQYRPGENTVTGILGQNTSSVQAGRRAILPLAVSHPKPTLARPGGVHITTVTERMTISDIEEQLSSRGHSDRIDAVKSRATIAFDADTI
ncbi:hypothetical protein PQX77_008072 [Marasmius sp. AFHP31]|nr:hypothetical protein PQX77_008072 [Marasmius sp. AFHP31]